MQNHHQTNDQRKPSRSFLPLLFLALIVLIARLVFPFFGLPASFTKWLLSAGLLVAILASIIGCYSLSKGFRQNSRIMLAIFSILFIADLLEKFGII
jgi:uncharacterized membrane protein